MTARFALLSYSTKNLGDEIQSIAARQFLPSVDALVDRDEWTPCPADAAAGTFKIILNGWFTHRPEKWPPPMWLSPLPISLHITRERLQTLIEPAQALVAGESLDYLKRHAPIGGRDLATVDLLERHGVESYFSGCVSLTLGSDTPSARGDYICAADLDDGLYEHLAMRARSPILRMSHRDGGGGTFQQRCAAASRLLALYARAKCVVTTRLHCAMPCIAFGTPTLFINKVTDPYRLSGLIDLVRSCTASAFTAGEVDFNFDYPTANSGAHLHVRRSLTARLQAFTGMAKRPFEPHSPAE